ncbi:hypothetical protein N7448_008064 [Penicillium atrosanguineum]|nr:hypothetical protein N7448_008064 [Penicillium atrosanguineum]
MHTAIKRAAAGFIASEASCPLLGSIIAHCLAFHVILLGATQHLGLHFTTITTGLDRDLASTTQPFVARKRTCVFTTWEQITTYFTTAPSLLIMNSDRRNNLELVPWMYKEYKDLRDKSYRMDADNPYEAVSMSDRMNVGADQGGV